MKIYKKHRRLGMLLSATLVAATAVLVAVTVDNPVGELTQVVVSGIAVVLAVVAIIRRVTRPAADCGVFAACAASLSVAFSMLSGGAAIAIGATIGLMIVAATTLLVLSAEAAAQETHSRLSR